MPVYDKRNVLRIGPSDRASHAEIMPAMVEAVRQRIRDAGGILTVWAVLHEDVYESKHGDGFYLHVHGIALNSIDAQRLADLAGNSEWTKWYVKGYRLALENDMPAFLRAWIESEEFTIGDFVAILSEIPPGATASKLHTGTGYRKDGPFVALPEK